MHKAIKRAVIAVLCTAAGCGAVWGGLMLYRNASAGAVNVYPVTDFINNGEWNDRAESYGLVTTDRLQKVMLSETQTVTEIFVTEGQEVKKGDPLAATDTTLSDIDLEKAQIEYGRLEVRLEQAKSGLAALKAMRPHSSKLVTPPKKDITYKSHATPAVISGSGAEDDPFYILWGQNDILTMELLEQYLALGKTQEPEEDPVQEEQSEEEAPAEEEPKPEGGGAVYVAFVTRAYDALNGEVCSVWGLCLSEKNGKPAMRYYEPELPGSVLEYETQPEPYYQESGSDYTAAELEQLRNEKAKEITDIEMEIKIAEVELRRLQREVDDGIIRSTVDGTVTALLDPDEAFQSYEPFITVSGGGGYYIEVSMGEFDLGTVNVGQEVTVVSWGETYGEYTGVITGISDYPAENADSWSSGNNNVSYYPFTVFVDEDADLREFDYVSVTYRKSGETGNGGVYLENMFIRQGDGVSYVYVRGEDGKLEKRVIRTGKSLYGELTEIRGGLKASDLIAFPYGKNVKEGAKTNEATVDDFYSSAY